jgi:hypothetical protein
MVSDIQYPFCGTEYILVRCNHTDTTDTLQDRDFDKGVPVDAMELGYEYHQRSGKQ